MNYLGVQGASYVEKLSGTRTGAGYAQVGSTQAVNRQEASEHDFLFASHMERGDSTSSANSFGAYNTSTSKPYSDNTANAWKETPVTSAAPSKTTATSKTQDDEWSEW